MTVADLNDEVIRDLLEALSDEELCDVYLVASDGIEVPACRFALAARSKVLKRMLYGSFREAKSSTICMMSYSSSILQAVVEYCCRNDISNLTEKLGKGESAVREMVRLSKAADYLELAGLQKQADNFTRAKMTECPPLACAVFDEASTNTNLSDYAMQIIESRPYVTLDVSDRIDSIGGVESLGGDRLIDVFKNPYIEAGELFVFRMLNRWFEEVRQNDPDAALNVAHQCTRYIQFENIEPKTLLDKIQDCMFVSPDRIFDAVAKQALRASKDRVWSLGCRGRDSVERVLVEGAGVRDANGIYYRVQGLAKGDLYSKREVACGQQFVYTLSSSVKEEQFECRIFCSNLLTHRAVRRLHAMNQTSAVDPYFQPVVQILSIDTVPSRSRTCKYSRIRISDGDLHMSGTLDKSLDELVEKGEIAENSVVKVLDFSVYHNDKLFTGIRINQISVVNGNPGQSFGSPVGLEESNGGDDSGASQDRLQNLYSFRRPVDLAEAKRTKIPRRGWQVDKDGEGTGPVCTWIPAGAQAEKAGRGVSPSLSSRSLRSKEADTTVESTGSMETIDS